MPLVSTTPQPRGRTRQPLNLPGPRTNLATPVSGSGLNLGTGSQPLAGGDGTLPHPPGVDPLGLPTALGGGQQQGGAGTTGGQQPPPGIGTSGETDGGGNTMAGGQFDTGGQSITFQPGTFVDPETQAAIDATGQSITETPVDTGAGITQLAGLVDPSIFASIVSSLDVANGETIDAVDVADDGTLVITVRDMDGNTRQITLPPEVAAGGSALDQRSLELREQELELTRRQQELDEDFRRDELALREQIAQIDQEIEREKIRVDQLVAKGEIATAIETQNRIDARDRQARQLERDLFNANMQHQRDVLNLERSRLDLDRQKFLAELGSQPGNFFDALNVSRGLPAAGLGGPLPQGISRAVGLNPSQAANAGAVLGLQDLPQFGDIPQVGDEAAPANPFDLGAFFEQIGFGSAPSSSNGAAGGESPAPPPSAAPGAGFANVPFGQGGENDQGVVGGTPDQGSPVPNPAPGAGLANVPFGESGEQPVMSAMSLPARTAGPTQQMATTGQGQVQQALNLPSPQAGATQQQSPIQLPAFLQNLVQGGMPQDLGPLQLPDTGVPFLSPQQIAQMTPLERAIFESLVKTTGLRPEDFAFIANQRQPGQARQVLRQQVA